MSRLVCPNCDCTRMIVRSETQHLEDGIPVYVVECMCKGCGAQLVFENGDCVDNYTIEQAEEDKWK